jgi:hypothetical protein
MGTLQGFVLVCREYASYCKSRCQGGRFSYNCSSFDSLFKPYLHSSCPTISRPLLLSHSLLRFPELKSYVKQLTDGYIIPILAHCLRHPPVIPRRTVGASPYCDGRITNHRSIRPPPLPPFPISLPIPKAIPTILHLKSQHLSYAPNPLPNPRPCNPPSP